MCDAFNASLLYDISVISSIYASNIGPSLDVVFIFGAASFTASHASSINGASILAKDLISRANSL